jgi:hypothetical protein
MAQCRVATPGSATLVPVIHRGPFLITERRLTVKDIDAVAAEIKAKGVDVRATETR